jgi:hypothetical protein
MYHFHLFLCCFLNSSLYFRSTEMSSSSMSSPAAGGTGSRARRSHTSVVGTARAQSPRAISRVGTAREPSPGSPPPSSVSYFSADTSVLPSLSSGAPVGPIEEFRPLPVDIDVRAAQDMLFMREEQDRPANTRKAVVPKVREWEAFINHTCPSIGDHPDNNRRYIPNKDNTYKFLLYQALRQKRKQGGKRKRSGEQEDGDGGFDAHEYNNIMTQYSAGDGESLLKNPSNPIGVKMFDHYKMALQFIHGFYIQQRVSEESLFDPHIWSRDHKTLANIVKGRRLEISTAAFHEKMGTDATPYTQIDLIPKIEHSLWTMGSGLPRSQLAALRNRHAFLMTTAGILRFESLATRNLSEVFSFQWKGSRDVHDLMITMYQLPEGKWEFVLFVVVCFSSHSLCTVSPFVSVVSCFPQAKLTREFICLVEP